MISGDRLAQAPCLEQGHPESVIQDHVQLGFKYFHGQRLHNLSGKTVPVFDHPYSKKVTTYAYVRDISFHLNRHRADIHINEIILPKNRTGTFFSA